MNPKAPCTPNESNTWKKISGGKTVSNHCQWESWQSRINIQGNIMSLAHSLWQRVSISLKLPGNISASAQSDDSRQVCRVPTFLQRQLSYLNTVYLCVVLLKPRLHLPQHHRFFVPFQDYFNAVQWCCLHIELKRSKVPLTRRWLMVVWTRLILSIGRNEDVFFANISPFQTCMWNWLNVNAN